MVALAMAIAFACGSAWLSASQREWSTRLMLEAHRFTLAQRALQRDLLSARVGILRSYDSINHHLDNSRQSLANLSALSTAPEIRPRIKEAIRTARKQERLVERFKSNNALLQNALSGFAMAEGSGKVHDQRLATAILRLTLDTSPEAVRSAVRSVDRHLKSVPPSADGEYMRANATLLLDLLPAVDQGLLELRALRLDEQSDRLLLLAGSESEARRQRAARMVTGLIVSSIATISLFILWLVMLRLRNRHLQRVADNEHLIATVANLLIDARLFDGSGRLEIVLEQLVTRIGADRGWIGFSEVTGARRSVSWPDATGDVTTSFKKLTKKVLKAGVWEGDVLRIRPGDRRNDRLAQALGAEGITDTLFLRGRNERYCAVIGFAATHRPLDAPSDIVVGIAAAFAALSQAFERHMLAEERLALERKLAHSTRLETMGAVATGVAHNFNNILGAIGGFSEIASLHTRPGSPVRKSLDEIQIAVGRAAHLVEEILHFGRPHSGKRTSVDPIALVDDAVRMFEASDHFVEVQVEIATAPVRIAINFDQLQNVLLNILNNALQANASAGRIFVQLRGERLLKPTVLSHASLPAGQYAVITIADEGTGIAEAHLPRLFEPFFTTRAGGTGLGLSTAWEVVADHDGSIDVNRTDEGSSFSIWIPVPRDGEP